jgi:type I restriction enzyme S subunit
MVVEMGTEGVQTKPLGEVCEINQGNSLTKEQMNEDIGENPVLGGGKIIGYYNKTNREGNSITLTRVGDINITYMKIPHFLTDNGFSLICNDLTTTKYVYYYLSSNKQILQNSYKGTAQKVISKTNLKLIKIPIPSLQTQQRIVQECERLDKLVTDLEADIESDKSVANSYLKSFINTSEEVAQEDTEEYANIIISEESDEESD